MFSEKMPVFLFASTVFQVWLCEPVPLECVDAESKGDDGFKTVNLHAAFVRQFDGMLCLIFLKTPLLQEPLSLLGLMGRNPEQLAEFPTRSWQWSCIGRQGDVALSVHRDDASFLFHLYSSLWVIKWHCKCFSPYPQLVGQQFQVLTYLLGGYLRVDLSGLYVGMPQQAADGFNGYSVG